MSGKVFLFFMVSVGLVSCGTAYKEKTAPCKRPKHLTRLAPDPRRECGPMTRVNSDTSAAALTAIDAVLVK
ncbi:hypothetical protein J2046_002637 [Rhizobium petrolearium]|uniref:hypothetical protein n=1 Tax=Neorhizobium petrolearium TaxID=515361 RepID=UPI001AE91EF6|nr:hypothetical protein [Neorhizobium petrolearium]MBP1844378.1 hypothetical protein [Neorhizobium petrolearium]